jgi:hypothetical protein
LWSSGLAPKGHQLEASRGNRLGVRDEVAAAFRQVLDLKIGAYQDRWIVKHTGRFFLIEDHALPKLMPCAAEK